MIQKRRCNVALSLVHITCTTSRASGKGTPGKQPVSTTATIRPFLSDLAGYTEALLRIFLNLQRQPGPHFGRKKLGRGRPDKNMAVWSIWPGKQRASLYPQWPTVIYVNASEGILAIYEIA